MGSSPHARGTRLHQITNPFRNGIIPACAGNTGTHTMTRNTIGDHPRMRGEHSGSFGGVRNSAGSSPHARGTLGNPPGRTQIHGIIPACAGNTERKASRNARRGDHPRMRGEHDHHPKHRSGHVGSSPHARGTRRHQYQCQRQPGIIPACAGNTASHTPTSRRRWDHPRMRGEHPSSARIPLRQLGSSPHARGTQVNVTADQTPGGIIPACAGNTRTGRCPGRPGRDHPRMRGEHHHGNAQWDELQGSSPHARGTP